jgi:hypothetical protein
VHRTVPAMAITLAVFTFVQLAVPQWVRPHLAAPVRQTVAIADNLIGIQSPGPGGPLTVSVTTGNPSDWVLTNSTVDPSGRTVDALPSWVGDCLPPPPGPAGATSVAATKAGIDACLARLDQLGYRQLVVYQPASRFWALQWAETALFGALSGLLAWFCFWWTRRRLS